MSEKSNTITKQEAIKIFAKELNIPFEYELIPFTEHELMSFTEYEENKYFIGFLTVKFPEITIKNSKKHSKYLGNMYVLFKIYFHGAFTLLPIFIVRDVYDIEDYYMNDSVYTHSHVASGLIPSDTFIKNALGINWVNQDFCFGSSILGNKLKAFDTKDLNQIIFLFKKFLEWESLEGVPYNEMTDLGAYHVEGEYINLSNYLNENPERFLNDIFLSKVSPTLLNVNNYYINLKIKFDEELLRYLHQYLPGEYNLKYENPGIFDSRTRMYVVYNKVTNVETIYTHLTKELEKRRFKFKGEIITPKISKSLEDLKAETSDIINLNRNIGALFSKYPYIMVDIRITNFVLYKFIVTEIIKEMFSQNKLEVGYV